MFRRCLYLEIKVGIFTLIVSKSSEIFQPSLNFISVPFILETTSLLCIFVAITASIFTIATRTFSHGSVKEGKRRQFCHISFNYLHLPKTRPANHKHTYHRPTPWPAFIFHHTFHHIFLTHIRTHAVCTHTQHTPTIFILARPIIGALKRKWIISVLLSQSLTSGIIKGMVEIVKYFRSNNYWVE